MLLHEWQQFAAKIPVVDEIASRKLASRKLASRKLASRKLASRKLASRKLASRKHTGLVTVRVDKNRVVVKVVQRVAST
jgi:hypothetical protein